MENLEFGNKMPLGLFFHKLFNPKRILEGILKVSSFIVFPILWSDRPSKDPLQDATYWNKTCTPKKDFCEHFHFDNFAGDDCTNSSSKTPISGVGARGKV